MHATDKDDPLPRLRGELEDEFRGTVPQERIDRAAKEAVAELSKARIRDYIPVLAWRRARELLRRGVPGGAS